MPARPATPPVELPPEMAGLAWTTKDFARYMGLSTKRVKAWWKRLNVPPDRCARNSLHRWSPKAALRLLTQWRADWEGRNYDAVEATRKFAGLVKAEREKRQLRLKLTFK